MLRKQFTRLMQEHKSLLTIALATAGYATAFLGLYPLIGGEVAALSALPVILIGWHYGLWTGVLGGLAVGFGFNLVLLALVGAAAWNTMVHQGTAGSVTIILIGATVGYMSQLRSQLKREFAERERMEEALRQAQKLESLGLLAGGVAHDFNNLLGAILAQASVVQLTLSPDSPAQVHIDRMINAAERAADLVRQMLAYSGRGRFVLRLVNLNELIQENLLLFNVALPKNVRLVSHLADAIPSIEADLGQMQQVIMNLITNAAEALSGREGTITITTGQLLLATEGARLGQYTGQPLPAGRYITLEVRDEGYGMDEKTIGKIFDPFFTTKADGRGLGLATVLGIVRGHKGDIDVESHLGRGTVFRLYFPAANVKPAVESASPSAKGADTQDERLILVIDDEPHMREAVVDILSLSGMQAITAPDGVTGVELYRQQADAIKLVLLDLSMPGWDGEETLRHLRDVNPAVPVVISSGYDRIETSGRFSDQTGVAFLQKPYDAGALIEMVQRQDTV